VDSFKDHYYFLGSHTSLKGFFKDIQNPIDS
jgi:hypothetical protein